MDGSGSVSHHGHEVDFEGILKSASCTNGLEPVDDGWDVVDRESPTLSSRPSTSPPVPPRVPHTSPQTKNGGMNKAWGRCKKLLMKKFGRKQVSPKLSDKLVPERGEVKWYETLFSGPRGPPRQGDMHT